MHESYEPTEGCRPHRMGCGRCNAPKVVPFARQIKTRLRMHCVWVSQKIIPASAGSRTERCLTLMPKCLQNLPHTKPTGGSKRAPSEPQKRQTDITVRHQTEICCQQPSSQLRFRTPPHPSVRGKALCHPTYLSQSERADVGHWDTV